MISFYKSSPPNNKRRNAQASDDKIYKDSDECPCVGSSYVEFLDGKVFNYNATCGQYSLDLNQLCENATRNSDEWWVHMKKIMEQHVTYNCNRSQLFESHKVLPFPHRIKFSTFKCVATCSDPSWCCGYWCFIDPNNCTRPKTSLLDMNETTQSLPSFDEVASFDCKCLLVPYSFLSVYSIWIEIQYFLSDLNSSHIYICSCTKQTRQYK